MIVAAMLMPRVLAGLTDRSVMLAGGALRAGTVGLASAAGSTAALLPFWVVAGFGLALTRTPVGRLIALSAAAADRRGLFAAEFPLSHACLPPTNPT